MSPSIHDTFINREVIAIDQDKAGHQPKRVWQSGQQEAWSKELAGGDIAVAVFNRAPADAKITFRGADAGISTPSRIRDLWRHSDQTPAGPEYWAEVPGRGVVLLRVR
jgi:alpha-galactosidase